ncbi:hypothetical protein O0Q50_20105 [Priestia aryabhattai]|uniref:Uncharacterized protein n=1 Tax=Priestia aryabhattai TaxID=412384 RepID=A0AAX6NC95_PRIAR|nr:hypothetical protein [Priestia aryabhattai]MDU9693482.1 hypothetical protein [Priestia aryabhattai]NGY88113.1 hypothetical protein [Priestia megaterium]
MAIEERDVLNVKTKSNQFVKIIGEVKQMYEDTLHVLIGKKVILIPKSESRQGRNAKVGEPIYVEGKVTQQYEDTVHVKIKEKVMLFPKSIVNVT